eukprot:snap_masked-scaffold_31-processed-gene-0.20-mRNA-1 protein AED:1.00 eAED:1.00 QI:0/0/0/0/1/1/2/0/63
MIFRLTLIKRRRICRIDFKKSRYINENLFMISIEKIGYTFSYKYVTGLLNFVLRNSCLNSQDK